MKIDVASDGLPIALEIIGGIVEVKGPPNGAKPITEAQFVRELFAFACTLLKTDELGQTALTEDFCEEIVDTVSERERELCTAG